MLSRNLCNAKQSAGTFQHKRRNGGTFKTSSLLVIGINRMTNACSLSTPRSSLESFNSPPPTRRNTHLAGALERISEAETLIAESMLSVLDVPNKRPGAKLGPTREFYEKHNLTVINNLMGLSCLFFLFPAGTIMLHAHLIMELQPLYQTVAIGGMLWLVLQAYLSIMGDFLNSRLKPESRDFFRLFRFLGGVQEKIVVTAPNNIESWKLNLLATKVDVFFACSMFCVGLLLALWQGLHGAHTFLIKFGITVLLALICKFRGSTYWKGKEQYDPKGIWWFNFFHFFWHVFGCYGIDLLMRDLCENGLRC